MGATQEQIYDGLDADLSWSEQQLPERERTKQVHRLHPYLGKYVPQLVEQLFRRHVPPQAREQRYQRHVNRRTGRRAGEYEDVLVARRTWQTAPHRPRFRSRDLASRGRPRLGFTSAPRMRA